MSEQMSDAVKSAVRLREALERVAAALVRPSVESLLDGEVAVERALAEMRPLDNLSDAERAMARHELEQSRALLLRCRRLGASLTDFVRVTFEAQGRGPSYGPRSNTSPTYSGAGLDTRI